MGQTVNLVAQPSQVRILLPPVNDKVELVKGSVEELIFGCIELCVLNRKSKLENQEFK